MPSWYIDELGDEAGLAEYTFHHMTSKMPLADRECEHGRMAHDQVQSCTCFLPAGGQAPQDH